MASEGVAPRDGNSPARTVADRSDGPASPADSTANATAHGAADATAHPEAEPGALGDPAAELAEAGLELLVPAPVRALITALVDGGHAAFLVGGSLRDLLLGREPDDWDLATDARPDRLVQLLPGAVYENAFGTVVVRRDGIVFEITTFRIEHEYADFRRPHKLQFGDDVEADLARRDFTVNALAWGRGPQVERPQADAPQVEAPHAEAAHADAPQVEAPHAEAPQVGAPHAEAPRAGAPHLDAPQVGPTPIRPTPTAGAPAPVSSPTRDDNRLIDRFGGRQDLAARLLRAVGDPDLRFREDALRMVRGVRLAATLGFDIEPATLAAIARNADLVRHLSCERIGAELERLLRAPRPSVGLALLQETGLLAVISPELAAQRGIPQDKHPGEDLWDHTLRAVDAVAANDPLIRLTALVHDIGKPSTLADGHFPHHDTVGAQLADDLLRRLRTPRAVAEAVTHLVRHHMFTADPTLSDAAVRRFIKRIGADRLDDLFALRRADDIGSGTNPDDPRLVAFRQRVNQELHAAHPLNRGDLAVDGTDLQRDLRLGQGPRLGRILDALLEQVIADPALNTRESLLLLAQGMLADMDNDAGNGE